MERYKREMYEKKYREVEKQERKKKRIDEKSNRKLENLESPEPPHVPRKSDTMQHQHNTQHQHQHQHQLQQQQQHTHHMRESDYDAEAKSRMQDQLACDTQTFVLNQLMLSIQFHGNYER